GLCWQSIVNRSENEEEFMAKNEVTIAVKGAKLGGELEVPANPLGLVIFAHGSGSSRHSPRNQYVARVLQDSRVGTLLFDLLTAEEEEAEAETHHLRFDISFLAQRLIEATHWALGQGRTHDLSVGYFGSSTGAAAALVASTNMPGPIRAVVSR